MADFSNIELTVVMPCLNEAETLEACIRKAQNFFTAHAVRGEIVVGDNGSTDGSQRIAERCGARVVHVARRGYGAALFSATQAARGKYVIMGDSDDSYDFSGLMPFLQKLREGYDLVMGNRFRGGISPGAMPWKNRWIGNPFLSGVGRLLFKCPVGDFHCGLRGYSLTAFRQMDLRTTGMEFASEMVIKSTLMGLRIAEVPTTLSPDGRSRPPHLRPWRDGWRHLRFMLLYSPRWLFLYPGCALMLLGLLIGAWLLPGPRAVGNVAFDVHTLLYAASSVFIGFQCVTFAILAKAFAVHEGLLPKDPRLDRLFRHFTLETGLIAGTLLLLVGFGGSIAAVASWDQASYGALDPVKTLRTVIPSVLCLTLGSETILASLLLSVLHLRVRPFSAPSSATESLPKA
jgi:glycosyltransferase involved in cell wall biosynthesis